MQPCPHDKRKDLCAECNPCPHGKLKDKCVECKKAKSQQVANAFSEREEAQPRAQETPRAEEEAEARISSRWGLSGIVPWAQAKFGG